MGEFSQVERDGRILIVTIDRPEVMNALHPLANRELAGVFDDFAADPDLWVAIITGAGDRAFSAGNDLKFQAARGKVESPVSGFGGITSRLDCPKPLIAAVNGLALGGGFEIVLACDLVIASEKASFGLPEPRVGLAALAGGLHRLPRQIGMKPAMGMLLTGRRVEAREAQALGIVLARAQGEVVRVAAPMPLPAAAPTAPAPAEAPPPSPPPAREYELELLPPPAAPRAPLAALLAGITLLFAAGLARGRR
jgi:enoyl-CoA hydratase/carnithine racemase